MFRSTFAVLVGYLVISAGVMGFTLASAPLVESPPGPGYSLINLAVSLGVVVFAGFLTATFAGRAPILHAGILGGILFVLGVGYQLAQLLGLLQPGSASTEPLWYLLLLPILSLPAALVGGFLRQRQLER